MKMRLTVDKSWEASNFATRMGVAGFKVNGGNVVSRRNGGFNGYFDVDYPEPRETDLNNSGLCEFCGGCLNEDTMTDDATEYVALRFEECRGLVVDTLIEDTDKHGRSASFHINYCPYCGNYLGNLY